MTLDWDTNSMPTPELRDSRAAVVRLVLDLQWVESFSYRFRYPQHVNLLELEALISLIRGLWDRGLGIVVCTVWATADLFLDQCVKGAPAATAAHHSSSSS